MYAKTRKEFGRHARFDDEPCEVRTRCRRAPSSHDPASESPVDRARTDFRPFPALPTQVVSDIRPEPELKQEWHEEERVQQQRDSGQQEPQDRCEEKEIAKEESDDKDNECANKD